MPTKKKSRKMDPKLVSKQKHEIAAVAKRHNIKPAVVRAVVKEVGISRKKIYARLREMGYTIKVR